MSSGNISRILVTAQFSSIAVLLVGGSWCLPWWSWVLFAAGLLLFAWAVRALGRNFSVMPEPKQGNTLVRIGPYRWLRHPMYSSVILCGLAVTLGAPSIWRLIAIAVCVPALVWKVLHEEKRIGALHPSYAAEMQGTFRLFPFVW